ncbi:MAG TPA: TetR/AcrR family transcriptional regulator [Acidimicrobiales bacterium]|nr:TetR/AcrR family transcriptional regulator [Acidimicrobiales bacterium]
MTGELLPETRDRILEGALQAMGRVGLRRLTMADVAEAAHLSRGTVYRYFPSKEDLLAVLAEYERDRFSEGLRRSLADEKGRPGLEALAEYLMKYLREHPALTLMIDTEPAFVLGFFRRQLPVFHQIADDLLGEPMEQAVPVQDGRVTVAELNELLLRLVLCVFLVPGESSATAGVLEGVLDSLVRLAAAPPSRRGTRR